MKWLSGADAGMLYTETPNVHMHTLTAVVIELDKDCRNLDIETFRGAIHERLYKLEPFCYQLVDIPFKFHHPMWREHCEVDLTYHIRPWRLPSPGGRRELDGAIGEIGSTPLDRSRPLWEMYFVEGLADNRVAVVGKIHHALIDGGAARNLFARGMDLQPVSDGGPYPPDPVPTKLRRIRLAFAQNLRQAGRIPRAIGYTVGGEVRVRRSSRKLATPRRPFTVPPTFMNHFLAGPERRFASCTLALADVKQTAKHLGVTINDLVLAMSTAALRTLLLRYDGKADPLLAMIPVSPADLFPDRTHGNFSDAMSVTLPVDLEDPLERLRRCHENVISGKESRRLRGPELLRRWLSCAPPVVLQAFIRLASSRKAVGKMPNLSISNVAGPFQRRGRVGGALVTEFHSVGQLVPWSGLNITVWSYVDQLNISVLTDGATVEDPHEVTAAMSAELIEIRRSAGLSEQLTVMATALG